MPKKPKHKYIKIYTWLSEQIQKKKFLPGDKIPNETELAEMFQVHRMTVRQAIDKLVGDHMLIRVRGKGTFLLSENPPVFNRNLENISSYQDDIVQAGFTPKHKTLTAMIMEASEPVAKRLNIAPGAPIIYLKRVMLANDVPLVLERSYLPEEVFPDLLEKKLNATLYSILYKDYGMNLISSRHDLGAILPEEKDRRVLKIDANCACIWTKSVVYNSSGREVEFFHSIYRGDKYTFQGHIGGYVYKE